MSNIGGVDEGFDSGDVMSGVSVGRRKMIGDSRVSEEEWKRDALIRIPRVTRDALKLLAAIQRKTMNVLLVEIVDAYVSRHRNNRGFGEVFDAFIIEEDFVIKGGE